MSLNDQIQRVLYRLKTEGADKVQRDFDDIAAAEQGAAREAMNIEKAVATIGIQAEQTKSKLTRMVESAGGGFTSLKGTLGQIGGGFQSSIKGLNDMMGKLAPWNQALELGGKAVKFVDESFDVLAKKEPGRRAEIEATRKSFKGLGEDIKQATAELVLFVADGWKPAEDALKKARETEARVRKQIAEHFGLGKTDAIKGISAILGGDAMDSLKNALDNPWGTGVDEMLEGVGVKMKELEQQQKRTSTEAGKLAKEYEALGKALLGSESASEKAIRTNEGLRASQQAQIELVAEIEGAVGRGARLYAAQVEQLNELVNEGTISWEAYALARQKAFKDSGGVGSYSSPGTSTSDARESTRRARETLREEAERREQEKIKGAAERRSTLESAVFGTISKDDTDQELLRLQALGAGFTAFSDAVGAGYEAIVNGQGGVSRAFRTILADGLMAIGKSSVVHALRETAMGFAALALGPIGGASAAMHFKAAALHGAVAVAAGLAANSIGTSSQAAASDKAAADKAREEEKAKKEQEKRASGGRSGGASGESGGRDVIVAYLDPWAQQPEHIRRAQARDMAQAVLGSSAVERS